MNSDDKINFNYILFDWDGCLAKTLDLWLKIYKDIVKKRGIKVGNDLEFVEKSFGKWAQGFTNVGVKDADKAYDEALQEVEKDYADVELYEGARVILEKLKLSNKKIALLTSSFRRLVEPALKKQRLTKYFDFVITVDEVKKGKPDPEIIEKALSFLRADKTQSVIIGDSDHDVIAGKKAGISTILFYPENNKKFYRESFLMKDKPDFVIHKLNDLLKIVNG